MAKPSQREFLLSHRFIPNSETGRLVYRASSTDYVSVSDSGQTNEQNTLKVTRDSRDTLKKM
jgi:hypothetical protein